VTPEYGDRAIGCDNGITLPHKTGNRQCTGEKISFQLLEPLEFHSIAKPGFKNVRLTGMSWLYYNHISLILHYPTDLIANSPRDLQSVKSRTVRCVLYIFAQGFCSSSTVALFGKDLRLEFFDQFLNVNPLFDHILENQVLLTS